MADKRGPADLDEVFEELERTGALAKFRESFRGVYRKLPQSVPCSSIADNCSWILTGQLGSSPRQKR